MGEDIVNRYRIDFVLEIGQYCNLDIALGLIFIFSSRMNVEWRDYSKTYIFDLSLLRYICTYIYILYIYISDDAINRKSYLGNTNICDDMDIRQFGYLPIRG